MLVGLWVFRTLVSLPQPRRITYTELLADVEVGRVQEALVEPDDVVAKRPE